MTERHLTPRQTNSKAKGVLPMADKPNDLEQEVAELVAAGFEKQNDTADHTQEEQEGKRFLDVDLYRLPNGGVLLLPANGATGTPLDTLAVESNLVSQEVLTEPPTTPLDAPNQEPGQEEPEEIPQPVQKKRRIKP